MADVLILGGGAVGLSTAYELASRGRKVQVLERAVAIGTESSWAGAGIVPPGPTRPNDPPPVQLIGHGYRLHVEWSQRLRAETGIDNEFRRCGSINLADDVATRASLAHEVVAWTEQGVRHDPLDSARVEELEPAIAAEFKTGRFSHAYHLPDEAQVRNPRHLHALAKACAARGVEITTSAPVESFIVRNGRIAEVQTPAGNFAAEQYCLCSGAWSGLVGKQLGLNLAIKPIRGQIVLLAPSTPVIRGIVYVGRKYFVGRSDGRLLVGSTEEDVGFDKSNTPQVVDELLAFAYRLAPELRTATIERTWAGLRPFSADGVPYLGRVPELSNAFVAAGHYRWGLAQSAITAVLLAQAMASEPTLIDLTPFRIGR